MLKILFVKIVVIHLLVLLYTTAKQDCIHASALYAVLKKQ